MVSQVITNIETPQEKLKERSYWVLIEVLKRAKSFGYLLWMTFKSLVKAGLDQIRRSWA